jgi:hypothetical protein
MGFFYGRTAGFRHADVTKLSFLDQFPERPGRFLDRNTGVDSSALEQIQLLCASEEFVDVVDGAPHTPFATIATRFDGQESPLRVFRVFLVECGEQVQVG